MVAPFTVAISGATGLVGSALATALIAAGHRVRRLVRTAAGPGDLRWDPARGELDADALVGCDAVIHLAGASIATRWTPDAKAEIRRSRVEGTGLIARRLAALPPERRPTVLVSASAVGWYGDRGDEVLTEAAGPGTGFLAEVGQAWEAAADPAREAGIRVVHPRIGIVLSGRGGALVPMARATRWGAGGPIGTGRQYISWIHIDDLNAMLIRAAFDGDLNGAFNATAPEPVTQHAFARALAQVLHRPAWAPLPSFAVTLAAGQMGRELLLEGQRVLPQRLLDRGFAFAFPNLDAALRQALGPEAGA